MRGRAFAAVSLSAINSIAALDWGKMNQYNSRLENPPKLNGNTIWVSGKKDEGFDIVLSQDAQAKVEGVLQGCGTSTDQKCYQDALHSIESADVELDSNLERRETAEIMSDATHRNTPTRVGIWTVITGMLWINWQQKEDKMDNSAFHLPIKRAKEAARSASASSLVLSAGGSVVVTITPTPVASSLTGSITPAVTIAPSDADGHKKGDLVAMLDANLAKRINEVAHRMTDCADGRKFDTTHGTRRRDSKTTYGQALCAAEGVIGMTGKGGAFADLTLLSHDKIGIEFTANAGKAKDALLVLKDFIIAYSPVMAYPWPPEIAEQLGTYLLAIIIDSMIIENIPIGEMNYIGPDLAVSYGAMSPRPTPTATSATPTSSSSGCPDPSKTPLFCGDEKDDCAVKLPDRNSKVEQDPVCADSKWKGCKCNPPTIMFDNVVSVDEYWSMQMALSLFKEFKDGLPTQITCRDSKLSAPISEKDADYGTSVEQAIETWCNDNDGKDVGSNDIYWRWGVTKLGVPNRSSFWLRAAKACDNPAKINKGQCKKALTDGIKQCDKGKETHGHEAKVGCVVYSIDLSGNVDMGQPPWASSSKTFPPPLDKERDPICDPGKGSRPIADQDLTKAISAFCHDSAEIKGFGRTMENMFDYPPKNEPQWFPNDRYTMHLIMGAETVNNGGKKPYDSGDMGWCNYDWKMGRDDCTYALRKLYSTCTKDKAKQSQGGEITYRCVRYKSWAINMGRD